MRRPRVRFTLGRLMVAVLVAGLVFWRVSLIRPQRPPTLSEQQAEASYKQAMLVREVAEYAIKEYYEEGLRPLQHSSGPIQIPHAKSDLERAYDRLKWANGLQGRGEGSPQAIIADRLAREQAELASEQAKFEREQAETQRQVPEMYTKHQQRKSVMKSLRSDLEKVRADEQSKLEIYRMERARRILGF